jgi:hypothetical protein
MEILDKVYYPNQFDHKELSMMVGDVRVTYFTNNKGAEILQMHYKRSIKKVKLHKNEPVSNKYKIAADFLKKTHQKSEWKSASERVKII